MDSPKHSMIMLLIMTFTIELCLFMGCSESPQEPNCKCPIMPMVQLNTTMGSIILELDSEKAPVSVKNFLEYLEVSFYDSTIFHRVIPDYIIQGGQFTKDLEKKEPNDSIACESYNGLSNLRGTIGVSRASSPNSGTCQFFINLKDNLALDRHDDANPGYAVFGRVIAGMDVVDSIGCLSTSTQQMPDGTPMDNVPVTPVILLSVQRIK